MRPFPVRASRALAFIGICASAPLLHLALANTAGPGQGSSRLLIVSLAALSAAPHTTVYLTLLIAFGITVLPGREPLCAVLARKMHGPISDGLAAYAGTITRVWCVFFAGQLSISFILLLTAPLTVWSLFVNVLNLPLVAALYAAEYTYRAINWSEGRHTLSDVLRLIGHVRETVSKPAS